MTDFTCKDCKHSRMARSGYLSYIFELGAPKEHWYRCSKFPKAEDSSEYLVTGKKSKPSFNDLQFCSIIRMQDKYCGKKAKSWEPKKKKDLLKFLSKDNIE